MIQIDNDFKGGRMKTILISLVIFVLAAAICFADDPLERDSLIIETVYAELGDSTAEVNIYVTCDDSVAVYIMPLTWDTMHDSSSFYLTGVTYHNTLILWDETYDSLMLSQSFLRMIGWYDICGDDNPPLYTNNIREHCWTLQFGIDPGAPPHVMAIDSIYDPVNGSLWFGLVEGTIEFSPVLVPGAIFYGVTSGISESDQILPTEISLSQNYPNPFNASTIIKFALPEESHVELTVYNLLGQKAATIVKGLRPTGNHAITWDGSDYPSGIYFARLDAGGSSRSIKMVLLK
jgi:hypothetical protein